MQRNSDRMERPQKKKTEADQAPPLIGIFHPRPDLFSSPYKPFRVGNSLQSLLGVGDEFLRTFSQCFEIGSHPLQFSIEFQFTCQGRILA